MNKRIILFVVLLILIAQPVMAGVGNDMPSGAHFNLNLIGVSHEKENMIDKDGGHVIFVPIDDRCKIYLTQGDFAVLDKNGTDGEAAFRLPDPYDGVIPDEGKVDSSYSVYVRALGKPGGTGDLVLTVIDEDLYGEVSSIPVPLVRNNGKPVTKNVTRELLFIEIDGKRYDLFDAMFEEVFWSYDNNGLKLVQLRFYPNVPTTVFE